MPFTQFLFPILSFGLCFFFFGFWIRFSYFDGVKNQLKGFNFLVGLGLDSLYFLYVSHLYYIFAGVGSLFRYRQFVFTPWRILLMCSTMDSWHKLSISIQQSCKYFNCAV